MSGATTWGRDAHRLLSIQEAWQIIRAEVTPLGSELVSLSNAYRRVLAAPIVADDDSPPFDKAMMDGFAVRAADCAQPGATLRILGLAAAGGKSGQSIGTGEAVRINTGAPLPAGADAVVRIEDTTPSADGTTVHIKNAATSGQCTAACGSIRRRGDAVLIPPIQLNAAQLAAAATAGAAQLTVSRIVEVALITTGDELIPVGEPRSLGQIHEANGPMLAALMRQFDAAPRDLGIARDTPDELLPKLTAALQSPVVLASGGMSMGTLDLVPAAFEQLGVRWLFHGVNMRPGKPIAYGRGPNGQHIVGLPGNPVSSFVCAWLFARMIVRGLHGFPAEPPPTIRARLAAEVKPLKDLRPAYVPAKVWNDVSHGLMVEPVAWRGSDDPFGLALANALLVRSSPMSQLPAGADVDVIPLGALGA
ncbi:MAG: molybdopterin molybdotransferase MoeA [Planctomycetes bacterium]|nr:molybdopterin molybdotransferase MoeA [Planctomycetota bacterium]